MFGWPPKGGPQSSPGRLVTQQTACNPASSTLICIESESRRLWTSRGWRPDVHVAKDSDLAHSTNDKAVNLNTGAKEKMGPEKLKN